MRKTVRFICGLCKGRYPALLDCPNCKGKGTVETYIETA